MLLQRLTSDKDDYDYTAAAEQRLHSACRLLIHRVHASIAPRFRWAGGRVIRRIFSSIQRHARVTEGVAGRRG